MSQLNPFYNNNAFLEICKHLDPQELLNLEQLSKYHKNIIRNIPWYQMIKKSKHMKTVYNHSFGDEDILSTNIHIIKLADNKYKLIYKQSGFESSTFLIAKTENPIIDNKTEFSCDDYNIITQTTSMTVKTYNNPHPERIFRFTR